MSRLPEDWYEAINEATGVYTTRSESDRVADALEPLLRKKIASEIRAVATAPDRVRPKVEMGEFVNDFEWSARIAEEGTQT